jgi:uncharacterized RDD family membrane protein YckC
MSGNSIDITTSQNVVINYQIANLGDRMLASLLDIIVIFGYSILIWLVAFGAMRVSSHFLWVYIVLFIPIVFYSLLFEIAMQGQTPGKRWRQIKVVKMDGGQAGIGAYLIRWLFRIIEIDLFYGVIAMLTIALSEKRQRIGDMLAQTVVINVQDRVSLKDTLYEKTETNYMVQYPEVRKLSEEDIELIKKVMNTPEYFNNFEMVLNLTHKIQVKMGIAERTQGPQHFLKVVTRDYNYLCG